MTRNRPGIRNPPAATGGKNGSAGRRTGLVVRSRRLRNRKRSQERNSSFNTACACKTGVAMTGTISGTLLSAVTLTSSIFTVRCFKLRWRWQHGQRYLGRDKGKRQPSKYAEQDPWPHSRPPHRGQSSNLGHRNFPPHSTRLLTQTSTDSINVVSLVSSTHSAWGQGVSQPPLAPFPQQPPAPHPTVVIIRPARGSCQDIVNKTTAPPSGDSGRRQGSRQFFLCFSTDSS